MLTRIRNANSAKHTSVDIPSSKIKINIAEILVKEGYVKSFDIVEEEAYKIVRVVLKYSRDKKEKSLMGIKRISKPGLRVYAKCEDIPKVLGGLGTAIVSTNQGLITDKEARNLGVGGEVLAFIW